MNEAIEVQSRDPWAAIRRQIAGGDAVGAIDACRGSLKTQPKDAPLWALLGLAQLRLQNIAEAEAALSRASALSSAEDPELLNAMGIVRTLQHANDAAIELFSRCLRIQPFHRDALGNLAALHTSLKQPGSAQPLLDRLVRIQPESADVHARASDNALALDDAQKALRLGRKAVRLAPGLAAGRLALADALEACGRFGAAKLQYLAVLLHEHSNVTALSQLLALQGVEVEPQYAARAEELLDASPLPDADRVRLRLALARYHDGHGHYDIAFEHLQQGKSLHFKNHAFDSDAFTTDIDRRMRGSIGLSVRGGKAGAARPIFIVGMPRSGTTLVEQILASHSRVAGGGELPTIMNIAADLQRLAGGNPPGGLPEEVRDGLAQRYMGALKALPPGASFITDKMPFNFLHLDLIASLFPDAAIIHCRRGALDTCLSCYFTDFSEKLPFASDLGVLGRYWRDYHRLMEHWKAALPGRVLDVRYEQLVGDTATVVGEMLEFCALPWEDACLQFYRTSRAVRTPSRWQVRQPIYSQAIGRWRRYEAQLRPVVELLSAAVSAEWL